MLRYYAERLPAVEINNTFYRMPRAAMLEAWAAEVPEHFRFVLKASQRITHLKRLKGVADETRYLLDVTQALRERLGVLLFQLPPNLKLDLDRFERFLELLPTGTQAAFEFRHPSWLDPRVLERLRERSFAWVVTEGEEGAAPDFLLTAPWTYLRLRRAAYTRDELAAWVSRLRARDLAEAFVFFKHEDEGAGPRLAAEFIELMAQDDRRRMQRAAGAPAAATRREVG
jgi:uncharacterized protein YecE (DUF72 family)